MNTPKLVFIVLAVLLAAAVVSCGGPTATPVPPTDAPLPAPTTAPPTDTPVPPPPSATPVPPTNTPVPPPPTATPVPPAPEPAVPAVVDYIIANKCANCHVALPDDHTDKQDSDQCGLCHVPFEHAAPPAPEHTQATEGCTDCHNSPQITHFFLRDEEDQTVLASNAEEKCVSCHQNEDMDPTGAGVPALENQQDILASMEQGTLRSWIQPGGFMAKHLTANDVAVITDWIDSTSADRQIDYDPYLDAVKIDADFDISNLDDPIWDMAPEHDVSVEPTIYTATDNVQMKALYSDKYLYTRVEYEDSTASLTRSGSWILDDDQWRHPKAKTENDKQSEDRVSIIWNISTPQFFERNGCAIKCHGNVPGSSEFTDLEGSTMDIWHSKAARALGLYQATDSGDLTIDAASEAFEVTSGSVDFMGVLDDKRLIWYMDVDDGYDLEDSGRRGDAGKSMYSHNRNADKSAPLYIEIAPESWTDAMFLTQDEIDAGETIVADPSDTAYDAAAVAAAWDNYVTLKAVVPERVLREPEGSRGDVQNAARWEDGVWVNVFRRALATGNADDAQFDPAETAEFSIAVFDNCGRGEIPPGHTTYGDGQYQVLRFK